MKTSLSILALSLGLFGFAASPASAQTVISSVPYTISSSGHYILGGNLNSSSTAAAAITISAPNVILDLNDYYVAGPGNTAAANSTTNSVIFVGNFAGVTIKNGTVAGNAYGIYFSASNSGTTSRNYLLDGVTVTRCYFYGMFWGTSAPGTIVRNCSFSANGGSTNTANTSPCAVFDLGGIRFEANNINGVTATGSGTSYGINGYNGDFAINNTIANVTTAFNDVSKYIGTLTYGVTNLTSGSGTAVGDNN